MHSTDDVNPVSAMNTQHEDGAPLKQIQMCEINIQSMGAGEKGPTSSANVKMDQLRTILQHEHQFDVIGVTESWLTSDVTDEDIQIKNYEVFRRDRNSRGGGVCHCVYVRTIIPTRKRIDLEEDVIEITWVELQLKPRPTLVGIAYRPPNMLRNEAITYVQSLQENIMRARNNPNTGIYLLGDFNDKCQKWESRHSDS